MYCKNVKFCLNPLALASCANDFDACAKLCNGNPPCMANSCLHATIEDKIQQVQANTFLSVNVEHFVKVDDIIVG